MLISLKILEAMEGMSSFSIPGVENLPIKGKRFIDVEGNETVEDYLDAPEDPYEAEVEERDWAVGVSRFKQKSYPNF